MLILDANAILRYLLYDNSDMAERVNDLIATKEIYLTPEVIAEVIYVLNGVYKVERHKIKELLYELIDLQNINTDIDLIKCALTCYAASNIDFVDSIMYAYKNIKGYDVFTFDKKLNKLLENSVASDD